jgi:hypothetical protein
MSSLEQSSSLHVLSSPMFTPSYLCESDQQWWYPSRSENRFGDKDIPLSLAMTREKVEKLFINMCSTLQSNNCDNIMKCIESCCIFIPTRAPNKWVLRSSMVWPHKHHERWATIGCGKPRQTCNVVRKWAKDKWNVVVLGWINNQALTPGLAHEW